MLSDGTGRFLPSQHTRDTARRQQLSNLYQVRHVDESPGIAIESPLIRPDRHCVDSQQRKRLQEFDKLIHLKEINQMCNLPLGHVKVQKYATPYKSKRAALTSS